MKFRLKACLLVSEEGINNNRQRCCVDGIDDDSCVDDSCSVGCI